MSMPSASNSVQIGAMVRKAEETSRQERPAMEPESSIRKTVSKVERAEKGESVAGVVLVVAAAAAEDG